jgi:hypothetical protein
MIVELRPYEQEIASLVGRMRRYGSKEAGMQNQRGLDAKEEELLALDIAGAGAEAAVGRLTNRYWHGSVNAAKHEPDVGHQIQVRWTHHERGRLIVLPRDPDDQYYFLVTGNPPLYNVIGWIRGQDAKREEWIDAPAGRPPAYFVPQSALTLREAK